MKRSIAIIIILFALVLALDCVKKKVETIKLDEIVIADSLAPPDTSWLSFDLGDTIVEFTFEEYMFLDADRKARLNFVCLWTLTDFGIISDSLKTAQMKTLVMEDGYSLDEIVIEGDEIISDDLDTVLTFTGQTTRYDSIRWARQEYNFYDEKNYVLFSIDSSFHKITIYDPKVVVVWDTLR